MYLTRYPHRAPAVTGRTGRPQLSPAFVEALMGFPDGWTDGESRTDRLRMLGNAVVPQVAEAVGIIAGGLL